MAGAAVTTAPGVALAPGPVGVAPGADGAVWVVSGGDGSSPGTLTRIPARR
ncbi:hypothetical protein [Nocardioides szechwanensis]|uniref:hypothetical protein n=1 Tax=Nocardioides szechwanensis TaxID=1005944 RepID=UPI001478D810|nr:hypothetical protein [Nocardioides szechwanensis]